MKRNTIASVLIVLTFAVAAAAQTPFNSARLDQMFDDLEKSDRMMGSVTIAKNGKVIYTRQLGYRDLSKKVKNDAATMFRIGSVTKTFTAAMIFRLIDEKKLTLDTKLSEFFPEVANSERITIAHLLSKTSGLPRTPLNENYDDPENWIYKPQTKEQMLARIVPLKPVFNPGENVLYSNNGYVLLGYIIEAVSGMSYSQYFEKTIARKLGLKRTRIGGKVTPSNNEAASFYWDEGKWNRNPEVDLSVAGGAGAMVSTDADLVKFIQQLFATENILTARSQLEMTTPFLAKFEAATKGIAVGTIEIGALKKRVYQHDGGVDASMALLTYVPEDNLAISIITNGHNYPIGKIFMATLGIYYGQPVAIPSFKTVGLSDEKLAGYEGSYSFKEIGMTITIKKGKGNLLAQANGQDSFVVEPISESSFAHKESGIIIEFKTNAEGASVFDLYQQRGSLRFLKDK